MENEHSEARHTRADIGQSGQPDEIIGSEPSVQESTGPEGSELSVQLFNAGAVTFLLQFAAIQRWLLLSAASYGIATLTMYTIAYVASGGVGYLIGVLFTMLLIICTAVVLVVASVCCLAIVQDTVNGCDKIESWPDLDFLAWIADSFYVIHSLILGLLPGVVAGQLLMLIGAPVWLIGLCGALTVFILFPIFLLSMLFAGSAVVPVSATIWRSLFVLKGSWKVFYGVAGGLAIACLLAYLLLLIKSMAVHISAMAAITALMMIYFRVLGRLGEVICEKMPEDQVSLDDEISSPSDPMA